MVTAVVVVTTVVATIGDNSVSVRQLMLMEMFSGRFIIDRFLGGTNHRDGRKRLNRKAQCEQHDENEFAPVGHGYRV